MEINPYRNEMHFMFNHTTFILLSYKLFTGTYRWVCYKTKIFTPKEQCIWTRGYIVAYPDSLR